MWGDWGWGNGECGGGLGGRIEIHGREHLWDKGASLESMGMTLTETPSSSWEDVDPEVTTRL